MSLIREKMSLAIPVTEGSNFSLLLNTSPAANLSIPEQDLNCLRKHIIGYVKIRERYTHLICPFLFMGINFTLRKHIFCIAKAKETNIRQKKNFAANIAEMV